MFTKRRRIGAVEVELYSFLTLSIDVGDWSTLCPGRFTPVKDCSCSSNMRLNELPSPSGNSPVALPQRRVPRFPFMGSLQMIHSHRMRCREENSMLPVSEIEPRFFGCTAYISVTILTQLSRFHKVKERRGRILRTMETVRCYVTLINLYQSRQRHIPSKLILRSCPRTNTWRLWTQVAHPVKRDCSDVVSYTHSLFWGLPAFRRWK